MFRGKTGILSLDLHYIWTSNTCKEGSIGSFNQIENDFTATKSAQETITKQTTVADKIKNGGELGRDRRFRMVVCSLGLSAVVLAVMSRMILNLAIVEMVAQQSLLYSSQDARLEEAPIRQESNSEDHSNYDDYGYSTQYNIDENSNATEYPTHNTAEGENRFDWSVGEQNFLLASFYMGYAPAMFLTGGLADLYGSKFLILIAISGSSMVNLLTPMMARLSFPLLVSSRIMIGILQGGLAPALYDLFNRWLTPTEISVFAPMIKVGIAIGALCGYMLPGLLVSLNYQWPFMFYACGSVCFLWMLAWIPLASSSPQTNKLVDMTELRIITRKKIKPLKALKSDDLDPQVGDALRLNSSSISQSVESRCIKVPIGTKPVSWLQIVLNPSVLALTLVKFTYNLAWDFVVLELAVYLKQVHKTQTETISAIGSAGCMVQIVLISFVGWLARILVKSEAFGLSRTKWRKVFQGTSNLSMALIYFLISLVGSNLSLLVYLLMLMSLTYILGVGGESMVPYDLSSKYPATIFGFAHSVSIMSGLALPAVCAMVLGNDNSDPEAWNTIFRLLAITLCLGGLIFIFVLKSKPFLPGERELDECQREQNRDSKSTEKLKEWRDNGGSQFI